MTGLKMAVWYSRMAVEVIALPPFAVVFSIALLSLIWASIRQRPFRHGWKPYYWLVLTHALFFPMAITVGVIWENSANPAFRQPVSSTPEGLCEAIFFMSLASCAFWVWRMKRFRWFALSLMIFSEVFVLGALFVADMSITGDWL